MTRVTLAEVNALDRAAFVDRFGALYEHSPWVAEAAWAAHPFASLTALAQALADRVAAADPAARQALLAAHPDLAGRAALAGEVTRASLREQAAAGLDSLTDDEMLRFQTLNAAYSDRFAFPFILAVKHWGKSHILAAMEHRLGNDAGAEMRTALAEVDKIAFSRLLDLVEPAPTGRLTTHVLDTARGMPGPGIAVELVRLDKDGERPVAIGVTNRDGRLDQPLLAGPAMAVGRYRLTFAIGAYLLRHGLGTSAPAFLDQIPLVFAIANPEQHYHVPLLVSPWSYSTYRGS